MNKKIWPVLLILLLTYKSSYSSTRYLLCGPDEDGCYPDIYQYCSCTPYNEEEANKSFCLDFDSLSCVPLSTRPNCPSLFTFNNQAECVATIFQSDPTHPCALTTKQFCVQHHTPICNDAGQPWSCA